MRPIDIPHHLLQILDTIQQLDKDKLNPYQHIPVNYIEQSVQTVNSLFDTIPPTNHAYQAILPTLTNQLSTSLLAIHGYAKLLLDSPASFEGATITTDQRPLLEQIAIQSQAIHKLIESINQNAIADRLQARKQPTQPTNITELFQENFDIYSYWIRDYALQLRIFHPPAPLIANAQPYHLNALLQHIITIVATDLLAYGAMNITFDSYGSFIEIHLFCTGLQFNDEAMHTMFMKEGRFIYLEQLRHMDGEFDARVAKGVGSTIIIRLYTE